MSSGSYPGPFHGDVQMPLNEGTKDRHALRGPQRELSYSKHAPAPWPGERSHTQENSKLRKSQRWSHTPTKDTPWLINTTAQLCPDAGAHGSLRSPFCRRDPRSRAGGHRAEMRSQAPAQPRACPLPTVTRGDSSSTGRTNHSSKFQTKELNTETATLHRATSAWLRPAAATGQSPPCSQDNSLMCMHRPWACPQAQGHHVGASAATLCWARLSPGLLPLAVPA